MNLVEMGMLSEVVENMKSHTAARKIRQAAHTARENLTLMQKSWMYQREYGCVCLTVV